MRNRVLKLLAGCGLALALQVPTLAAGPNPAYAETQKLNRALLAGNSATLTLEQWCVEHHLAKTARIVAERVPATRLPNTEQRQLLRVGPKDKVGYRRVRLKCGTAILSEADNYYVPARLTPAMNRMLDTSDTPFGRAVQALNYRRQNLSAELLWPAASGAIPAHVLQHRALLVLPDGRPISLVIETNTKATVQQ